MTINPLISAPAHDADPGAPLSLAIADYNEVARHGLQAMLCNQAAVRIITVVERLEALLEALATQRIEVALVDLYADDERYLTLVGQTRIYAPHTRLLLFNSHIPLYRAIKLAHAGIGGVLPKHAGLAQILAALRSVRAGRFVLQSDAHAGLMPGLLGPAAAIDRQLMPRDLEVLQQLVDGATNKEIASQLNLASKTIEVRVAQICAKLRARSRTDAAARAVALGLVRPSAIDGPLLYA